MKIGKGVFIAENATIIGDVEIGDDSSVWFNAVLRGDMDCIRIGSKTNIQDNVVVHVDEGEPCEIGSKVTVGHSAVVHSCKIADNVLIGMGAIVLSGAEVGEYTIVGAGAVLTRKKYPEHSLILGVPGKVVRELTDSELELIERSWKNYVQLKDKYLGKE